MVLFSGVISLLMLFLLGAFFSAAETAMTALSRVDVRALKEQSPLGYRVEKLLEKPHQLIASLLIGNNIANISAATIVAYITELYLGSFFIALTTFILTLVIIIFCEIMPKQLALAYKRNIALLLFWPITFFYHLFWPLISVTIYITKFIFPALNRKVAVENLEESLEHMVDLARDNGYITPYERDFINNVLDLNDKTARQIMTHRQNIFSVPVDASLIDIYPEMIESSYSRIPVYEKDPETIVGILYLSDVQKFCLSHGRLITRPSAEEQRQIFGLPHEILRSEHFVQLRVSQLMKAATYLPDTVRVSDLFFQLKQSDSNLVIILDEYGGLAGLVSQEDVLEAVFGNLYDEDEKEEELALDIQETEDGFVFSGMLSIAQFEQFFDLELQVEENSRLATMSGYICEQLALIPEPETVLEMPEGNFYVLESDGKRIVRLRFLPSGH